MFLNTDISKNGKYLNNDEIQLFLEKLRNESCAKCKFWIAHDEPVWKVCQVENETIGFIDYDGECHRNPPMFPTESMIKEDTPIFCGSWPETNFNQWCGEFKLIKKETE